MSLRAPPRLVRIASERELLVLEDNPYGLLRYEGDPLPTLRSLDDEFVIYASTFSKILSPGVRLGWTAAPAPVLAKMNIGKQGSDLCSSLDLAVLRRRLLRLRSVGRLRALADRDLPPAPRRDARQRSPSTSRARRSGRTRRAACSSGRRCPTYIDTTDLLARALQEHVAFVPGRAAFVDGRGGSEMRLNFSGVDEDEIREGDPPIGEVVREQVALYGTLTGSSARSRPRTRRATADSAGADPVPEPAPAPPDAELAKVLRLPRKRAG